MAAHVGLPGGAALGASKAALGLPTKTWAAEFGPQGVKVLGRSYRAAHLFALRQTTMIWRVTRNRVDVPVVGAGLLAFARRETTVLSPERYASGDLPA